MTKKNSFKTWLNEDDSDNIMGGVTALGKAAFGAGKDILDANDKRKEKDAAQKASDDAKSADETAKKLIIDIQTFLNNLFDQFPNHGGDGGPEDLMNKYQTYTDALTTFKTFKGLSEQVEKFRVDMNRDLTQRKLLKPQEIATMEPKAKHVAKSGNLPNSLISFVKKESDFFKRLFILQDEGSEFNLPTNKFQSLLKAKIAATAESRAYDAAFALNILFLYLSDEFKAYAKTVGEIGRARKKEA